MKKQWWYGVAAGVLSVPLTVWALVPSQNVVKDFYQHFNKAHDQLDIPMYFPLALPAGRQRLYWHFRREGRKRYWISLSAQKTCQGEHFCTVASWEAAEGENPAMIYNRQNKEITRAVWLSGRVKAYYTPEHALASTQPAQLSFRCGSILHTLTWAEPSHPGTARRLVAMAESAIGDACGSARGGQREP